MEQKIERTTIGKKAIRSLGNTIGNAANNGNKIVKPNNARMGILPDDAKTKE